MSTDENLNPIGGANALNGESLVKDPGSTRPLESKKLKSGRVLMLSNRAKTKILQSKLYNFENLPLDTLFEICGHLAPKDVLTLAYTNKLFYSSLTAPNANALWISVLRQDDAPACPAHFTYPRWVTLLYGSHCSTCGTSNVHKADFSLLRRLCGKCKKVNLLTKEQIMRSFRHLKNEHFYLAASTEFSGKFCYWLPDVRRIFNDLAAIDTTAGLTSDEAAKRRMEFKMERSELVNRTLENAAACDAWQETRMSNRETVRDDLRKERFQFIKAHFEAMGYEEEDIEELRTLRECQKPAPVSDRVWKRLKPTLEEEIIQFREVRILTDRLDMATTLYDEFRHSFSPIQNKQLPNICDFLVEPEVLPFFYLPYDADVTRETFADIISTHSQRLDEANNSLKATLRSLIQLPSAPESEPEGVDILDLATSIFRCVYCEIPLIFGWQGVSEHFCLRELLKGQRSRAFRKADAPRSIEVIRAAGLDPATATVSDMDEVKLRYLCLPCTQPVTYPPPSSRTRFRCKSWKSMIHHLTSGCAISAEILTTKDQVVGFTPSAIITPSPLAAVMPRIWCCNHCHDFIDQPTNRSRCIQHLATIHGVTTVEEPRDLFIMDRTSHLNLEDGVIVTYDALPEAVKKRVRPMSAELVSDP